ncbi:[NiFe]-hydrogenase assembly chaperone HybE [Methylocystis echinoides]|uniref:[NiFe]-hydrogenase assembly chaperone HybE n=1 Tax=Methylocystis echinoides TaxID=29468 RepID=UPI003422999D
MRDEAAQAIGARLASLYAEIRSGPMQGVSICNAALDVEAVGFRGFGERALGVIVTPWFMNLVLAAAPDSPQEGRPGGRLSITLPAGDVEFICGALEGFGVIYSCSLFSPMFGFADMAAARETAAAAISALFNPAMLDELGPAPASVDRRALLRGQLVSAKEAPP